MARRRRVLLLACCTCLLTLAVLANYGPLHSYFDAKARLEKVSAGIADLTAQKTELQTELGRLSEADYLESLARQDLSYTRPGEQLYIVTGQDATATPASGGSGAGTEQNGGTTQNGGAPQDGELSQSGPGFLERVLAQLLDGP